MAYYRLLFLNPGNDVVYAWDFHSRNDMEAMHIAEGKRGLTAMELWDDARKIKRWDCFPPNK